MKKSNNNIKCVLVGINGYASVYVKFIQEFSNLGKLKIIGATILKSEQKGQNFEWLIREKCKIFNSYPEMLKSLKHEARLCLLPTPIHLHGEMTLSALKQGMHVLVEKPLTPLLSEIDSIVSISKKTGLSASVGFQDIYSESLLKTKQIIKQNNIGNILKIKGIVKSPRDISYYSRNCWAGEREIDGKKVLDSPINNGLSHQLNMMLFLAGDEIETYASPKSVQGDLLRSQDIRNFDTAGIKIITRNGKEIYYYCSHSCLKGGKCYLEVIGENGKVIIDNDSIRIFIKNKLTQIYKRETLLQLRRYMFTNVINKIYGVEETKCDVKSARSHAECVIMADESIKIDNVPDTRKKIVRDDRGERIVIEGIDELMQKKYDNCELGII